MVMEKCYMINASKFSLVLRQCRENAGLTQKQVADALNVERSTYAYYETGTTHPSGSMIIKLAKIFNIPYSVFMDAVGDTEFDNSEEDMSKSTLHDDSWLEREKMYTLPKNEQTFLVYFRSLTPTQKQEIMNRIIEMKKENSSKSKK